jgi:hypothetical protein
MGFLEVLWCLTDAEKQQTPASEPPGLSTADFTQLSKHAGSTATKRMLQLYACACCRELSPILPNNRSRAAIEVGERFADGLATQKELDAAKTTQNFAWQAVWDGRIGFPELFHDIFQCPEPLPLIDPRWLTSTVLDLATAVYSEGAFERMPILADALMDAGCDCEEILSHCRDGGAHVRGCWVVDLLLARR